MLASFFGSNIPLCIEKNLVGKLCKVLEIARKTNSPVGPKFVFEKMKFKVLDYIQHDFTRQRLAPLCIPLGGNIPLRGNSVSILFIPPGRVGIF